MKKIYIIIIVVLFALQLKAQFIYDKYGNIIPFLSAEKYGNIILFSSAEKYKDEIESYSIPSFIIPYMDNDSLCKRYNNGKTIEELENGAINGFDLRCEPISLKENGVCIKLKHGKLWRYTIEGTSVREIGFDLGFPKLPKGTYIAIIPADTTVNLIRSIQVFHSGNLLERHKKRGLMGGVYGGKLIIEYYEPDALKEKEDIVIKRITYGFMGFGNQRSSSYNEPDLKSGYWGSSAYSQCQKDVICSDIGNYQNEAKSVVYLDLIFEIDEDGDGYLERHYYNGTGFFLNKAGGYNSNDSPLLVTAGHLYNYEKFDGATIDIISDITYFKVITKYQNLECGTDDTKKGGIRLPCSFNRLALGSSYNEGGLPWYSPNKDYAILQASSDIDELSSYDLVYGAWSNSHVFTNSSNVGYLCIHHPKGDVKKINKDNDPATIASAGGFHLKYDLGLTEGGSSGAPVFNSSRQIVGFHVAGATDKDCNLIGQMRSTNGTFSYLYSEFSSILDPNNTGEATSSSPQPPLPSELAAHCRNCIQDQDETGIDCGGSCYPCGMQNVLTLKTLMDIPGNSVKIRYDLFAEPDPNTLLALKSSNNYSFEAGMNVYLKGGGEVEQGATFYAGIDAELMTEADRGCQNPCLSADGLFSPNGDGDDDYVRISQTFITKYDILAYSGRWSSERLVYQANNIPIYGNGIVNIWDGTGAFDSYNRIVLTYYDCNGISHTWGFSVTALGLKSAPISNAIITEAQKLENSKVKIEVYPNPLTDNITINYSGNIFPLEYKITDLTGKVVINNKTTSAHELVNSKNFTAGTYIITAKAGAYNLVQKLIKK